MVNLLMAVTLEERRFSTHSLHKFTLGPTPATDQLPTHQLSIHPTVVLATFDSALVNI